ncbi:hypothetical protein ACFQE1_00410 [Halobium palmae]|uniref:Uncharacterized protein n=1 Tax=Halobium palmae TaxID=1776492 RepID=A0ABD5RU09_9EURY
MMKSAVTTDTAVVTWSITPTDDYPVKARFTTTDEPRREDVFEHRTSLFQCSENSFETTIPRLALPPGASTDYTVEWHINRDTGYSVEARITQDVVEE